MKLLRVCLVALLLALLAGPAMAATEDLGINGTITYGTSVESIVNVGDKNDITIFGMWATPITGSTTTLTLDVSVDKVHWKPLYGTDNGYSAPDSSKTWTTAGATGQTLQCVERLAWSSAWKSTNKYYGGYPIHNIWLLARVANTGTTSNMVQTLHKWYIVSN